MTAKPARPSVWNTEPLREQRATLQLDRVFSPDDMDRIRNGLIPVVMEDKWFIYWRDEALYFHRNWTGNCTYVVHFTSEGEEWRMVRAEVNRDYEQYQCTNDDYDTEMISYLIDALLLRRPAQFPVTDGSDESVLAQWANVGRAMLGSHPDEGDEQV
ncbi:MAG: hypothetical protein OXU74_03855 [Gemmatimonadota bacterium]|nr:hypothetical protein [Gemmatimonadota bacterium]